MAIQSLRFGIVFAALAAMTTAGSASSLGQAGPEAARAQADTLHLGMADAIDLALDHSPGLQAAAEQARAADRAAAASFRQHFGSVEAVAWTSRYQDAQILRPISQELLAGGLPDLPFARDQFHYGVTFELPLFVGGKKARGGKSGPT